LLMDEPTTHLDMSSIDALAYALDQFQGTLIFISHDVYFIRALANHVVHVNAGKLTHYPGGYQYYLDKTQAKSEREGLTSGIPQLNAAGRSSSNGAGARADNSQSISSLRKEQKRLEAEQRQARSRERRAQQQRVHELEKEIQRLEARQAELVAELEKPETYETAGRPMELNRQLVDAQHRLAELNPEWEKEALKLSELETSEAD